LPTFILRGLAARHFLQLAKVVGQPGMRSLADWRRAEKKCETILKLTGRPSLQDIQISFAKVKKICLDLATPFLLF
jgi:hypothetical protein